MKKALEKYVIPALYIVDIVLLDQWVKLLTLLYVKDTNGFYIINKVLKIFFVKNEGMAWGMLQNKQVLFIILTPIVLVALMYFYYKLPFEKKFIIARICLICLCGGAIGNFIDRLGLLWEGSELFHGYVVDMIYVEIINFPVFNVADSFITVGFALMIFSMFFVYKENDFDLLFGKKKADEKIEEKSEEPAEEKTEE
ncbi:MAG: signal peptidase II [Lachnospiraceae bacterium]|nr:signal peptidase II [Lachnospiraceae bacterium]